MSENKLTGGCISEIHANGKSKESPVVQVINIKKITKNDNIRYRLIISDGTHFMGSLIEKNHHELVSTGVIKDYCLLKLKNYTCTALNEKKIVILTEIEVIDGNDKKIGAPISLSKTVTKPKTEPLANAVDCSDCQPVSSLNPYNNNWSIKVRVTRKDTVREWTNDRGSGKLFSIDLLDNHGGQIRCTFFNELVDKYFDLIQEGKVYKISNGRLKLANRKFNHLPSDYQLTLGRESTVQEVPEDKSIEKINFSFVPIDNLKDIQPNKFIDIVGIVHQVAPISTILSKQGVEFTKRSVTLIDSSLLSVELTLWNKVAEKYNEELLSNYPTLAIKSVKVSDFGGRSLSTTFSSQIKVNVDLPAAKKLKNWFTERGKTATFSSISEERGSGSAWPRTPIKQSLDLGNNEKPDTYTIRGRVVHIPARPDKTPWYPACPNQSCNKKVIENQGEWRCEKCQKSYPNPVYRWMLSFVVVDDSESTWLTAFDRVGLLMLKKSAGEVKKMLEQSEKAFEQFFKAALFQPGVFSVKALQQINQNGEPRTKRMVVGLRPIDFRKEIPTLLEEIESMQNQ